MTKYSSQLAISDPNFRLDFIGIGAAKSGTSWLSDNLRKHPQIYFPEEKELTYFNQTLHRLPGVVNPRSENALDWYHDFYKEAKIEQIKGELSVQYMQVDGSAQQIHAYHPNVKILAILRDPPKQVFSHFNYLIQRGVIDFKTLEEGIEKRPDLLASTFYYQQLKPYYELFPKEQIKVMLFDDMLADREAFYKEFTRFIGVDDFVPPTLLEKSNETKSIRFKKLTYVIQNTRHFITENNLEFLIPLLRKVGIVQLGTLVRDKLNVRKANKSDKPVLSAELEAEMRAYYQEDINQLEGLIDRDLSAWKKK